MRLGQVTRACVCCVCVCMLCVCVCARIMNARVRDEKCAAVCGLRSPRRRAEGDARMSNRSYASIGSHVLANRETRSSDEESNREAASASRSRVRANQRSFIRSLTRDDRPRIFVDHSLDANQLLSLSNVNIANTRDAKRSKSARPRSSVA